MFIITSKKYKFECPYSNDDFKKKFDSDIQNYTYRQLRKDFYLTDLYYGKREENSIEVHFHRFGKRDLDNPMFVGTISKGEDNSTRIEGKFKRKTSNLIVSLLIVIFWLFITVIGFTQNLTAGLILLAITFLAVYIFFWDNNTPQQIKEYFSRYDTPPDDKDNID